MPRRDVLIRNQLQVGRAEAAAVRELATVYNRASWELMATILDRWVGAGILRPVDAVDVMRRLGILQDIDRRIRQLERETGQVLGDIVTAQAEAALEQIERELRLLPPEIRRDVAPFSRVETRMVERFMPVAMEDVELQSAVLRTTLRRELQSGLIQRESFPNLVTRLMRSMPEGEGPAVWNNGKISAERFTRRLVIHANNAARQE